MNSDVVIKLDLEANHQSLTPKMNKINMKYK